ncbi:dTDP-4-dehydrorhamnose 3,5-epimerase [Maritalea porphyrae]|uniref:dTDP-4-dehydrorhamnose 3,5-epimerase n=1 Tax=Maritalea porphyrae TaxID=880732 RepID=A0ABQ5UQZ5_9HYPH|nr:dTDP-4-dehydrorhamnose 3,5-epimerase [Maritalea porphyrae]GLQ17623.1 dTDP-4-dehydrorhamnose 3,5-epimerase [Maritalea porphyrae]
MKFELVEEPMLGLKLIKRQCAGDERGYFSRLYCEKALGEFGWPSEVAQSNFSKTNAVGAIRGLHFQYPPDAEAKLVTCVSGAVFDVAVDLRKGSSTFGRWFGTELSAKNQMSLLVPKGFAHGFQALESDSMLVYFASCAYAPENESGVIWNDKDLAIDWPLPPSTISARDQEMPPLKSIGDGIKV